MKNIRVYQIDHSLDTNRIKFMGYAEMKATGINTPPAQIYKQVFDGNINTDELERIYQRLNTDIPDGYIGHSLSISDIVELYDETGSEFFMCDSLGFAKVTFNSNECQPNSKEEQPDKNQQLYDKVKMEYENFLECIMQGDKGKIIDSAFEISLKSDILYAMESLHLEDEQIKSLLTCENTLSALYENWNSSDYSYMEIILNSIDDYSSNMVCEQNDKFITVLIVEPGKEPYLSQIGNDLKSLQSIVEGNIECIELDDNHTNAIMNEEGKLEGLTGNRKLDNGDIAAGTFIICGDNGPYRDIPSQETAECR